MATHRALVTFPAVTGIAEDAVTNTLHFLPDPGGVAAALSALDTAIIAFYNDATTGVGRFLSESQSRAASAATIRWYDLAEPPPRVPVRTTVFTLVASSAATALPSECAIVLSFQAVKVSGVNQARRRGRIYIGPLNAAVSTVTAGVARPSSTVRSNIATRALALRNAATAANSPWSVWSEVNGGPSSVNDGWIDDSFDTQRRRGVLTTARTSWA